VTGGAQREPAWRLASFLALLTMAAAFSTFGCASLADRGQPLVPTRYQHRTGPFVILSNFPMADDPPAVRCLVALNRDMKHHMGFEPRDDNEPVEIYVLDSRNAFAHFLKFYYPDLPPRRAFFLAQGRQRVVYTYSSPRLEEDLRHEATHALLHGAFGDLPLWLDEGLAEYFEDDLAQPGVDRDRIAQTNKDLSTGWVPNLPRLESLTDIREMTPRDYREAWAWVHLLLNGSDPGSAPLLSALAESATEPAKLKFSAHGINNEQLLAHLKTLPSHSKAGDLDMADRSVRLQDRSSEPTSAGPPPPPRGVLQRLRAWIGL
jgi:Protein of unknown function (DUF1570)